MVLTGKCKEDFLKYYDNHSIKYLLSWTDFEDLPLVVKNNLIIEWFDSFGVYIGIVHVNVGSGYFEAIVHYYGGLYFKSISRIEATQKAIIKANEIYNNLNK